MNRYLRYTFEEYANLAKQLLATYWWFSCPVVIITMAYFAESPDMVGKLLTFAALFPVAKIIFVLIQMSDEEKTARENEQYRKEPANSIGPVDSVFDIPANIRRLHEDPNWGNKIIEKMKNPPVDDLPPEDAKILSIPAYKRRGKKIDLLN